MKLYLFLIPILLSAQQVDYNRQVMNKPTLTTINGGTLPATGAITKIDGSGHLTAAVSGTDYAAPGSITLPYLRATTDCGLVMNGSTDDTTALSNCINALPSAGGTIVFPAGTAIIGNLTITKSYVHLKGVGNSTSWNNSGGSTILKYPAAGTLGGFVVRFHGTAAANIGSGVDGMHFDGISRAANGLWLTNVYGFKGLNWSIGNVLDGYALVLDATGLTTTPRCGDGGGSSFFDNFNIFTTNGASGGIILGTASYDVCSLKFGKGIIFWSGIPPYHGIYAKFLDSSTFTDVQTLELTSLTVSGVSCTSNVCTVTTSTPHLISGIQGVWMRGGSNTLLNGSFAGTSTGTYTFTIPVVIANGSYTATYVNAVGVALGTSACASTALGCAWDNWFGALLSSTGVYEFDYPGTTDSYNTISSWNWYETAPSGSDTYGRPGKMAALDVKGGMWNYTIKTGMKFQSPFPVLKGIDFQANSIVDYGIGIDFANSTPGSAGYNALRLANNVSIAGMNYGAGATLIMMTPDTDSNIALGNTSNASTTKLVAKNHLQLAALTAPTCNAANRGTFNYVANGAGFKDILYICVKNASDSYIWFNIY